MAETELVQTESLAWAIWKRVRGILAADALLMMLGGVPGKPVSTCFTLPKISL